LQVPSTEEEWKEVSNEFLIRWNFPHCIGAMDGKHVAINCPANSGSNFYNYKNFFSIVLFTIVDADYKFVYVDVGKNGRISDGGIFANTPIYTKLENNDLKLPTCEPLPDRVKKIPYMIVGDDAFPLKPYLMKPYPSHRLSQVRRIVENVFGILSSRFGVFQKPIIPLEPEKVEKVVLASCVLYNFLRTNTSSKNIYTPPEFIDREINGTVVEAEWRQNAGNGNILANILQQGGNRSTCGSGVTVLEYRNWTGDQEYICSVCRDAEPEPTEGSVDIDVRHIYECIYENISYRFNLNGLPYALLSTIFRLY
jgi:hypothetical protein